MKVYVVQRNYEYGYDCTQETDSVFSSREKAIDYLAGDRIDLYRHVGEREFSGGFEPYEQWSKCKGRCYRDSVRDEIVEHTIVGITEKDGYLGHYSPDGRRLYEEIEYEIEEFEVDNATI